MKSVFLFILAMFFMPTAVFAGIIVNEVTWMGTVNSANDEWMEIKNSGGSDVDLTGWILEWKGGEYKINFSEKCVITVIPAGSYFLLERTDDTTVPDIAADCIYTGALANTGEYLILKDSSGNTVDSVDASAGWPAGDNTTKQTMQWNGSAWITADATPKVANSGSSQTQQQTEQPTGSQSSGSSSGGGGGGGSEPYVQPELLPKIKAYAGEDKTVFVGAAVEFRGMAYGLTDKPLDNARYLWTFGDGGSKEGQNITHIYRYPGDYIIALNVSSGEYSVSDYMIVKVIPNQVFISEVAVGTDSFIELQNKSTAEIDISGIQLKSNGQTFIFPQNSRIKAGAYLVIPFEISNITLAVNQGLVEMFYPGGFDADSSAYNGVLKQGESFNRGEGGATFIAQETPGTPARLATQSVVGGKNATPTVSAVISTPVVKETAVSKPEVKLAQVIEPESESSPAPTLVAESENQIADISAIQLAPKSNFRTYLLAVFGLALFAAGAVLFIRRKSTV